MVAERTGTIIDRGDALEDLKAWLWSGVCSDRNPRFGWSLHRWLLSGADRKAGWMLAEEAGLAPLSHPVIVWA